MTKTYELINFATTNTVASFDSREEAHKALAANPGLHVEVVAFDDEGLVDDEGV